MTMSWRVLLSLHHHFSTWLQHPPPPLPSVGVKGGGEDDVPADGQRGLLHLAPQDGVSHDAGGLPNLLQHLVQALDAAHHCAFLDVGELGDLGKRLWWVKAEQQEGETLADGQQLHPTGLLPPTENWDAGPEKCISLFL